MTNKNASHLSFLDYIIELTSDEDGVRFSSIPLRQGRMTQDNSREETLAIMVEGIPIPKPTGVTSS